MTDDSEKRIELSRRTVLGSVGTIGAAGAMGGAGTMAFFNDPENFEENVFRAGKMDLRVDWQEEYNGEKIDALPDTDDDGVQDSMDEHKFVSLPEGLDSKHRTERYRGEPLIDLRDVKPGDSGEVTISLHVFGNDALVWLNGRLRYASENGTPEPERKDPDEMPDVVELLDEIEAVVWYDRDCDNVLDSVENPETIITNGSLRTVLSDLSRGVRLDPSKLEDDNGNSNGNNNGNNDTCEELGKVEYDDQTGTFSGDNGTVVSQDPPTFEFDADGTTVVIQLSDIQYKEGTEITRFDYDIVNAGDHDLGICQADLFGGARTARYGDGCATSGDDLLTPLKPGGQRAGLSNLTFYYCPRDDDGNGDDGDGCFVASNTYCIGFEWQLPVDHANEIMTDRVAFDLGFEAEQCRHNDPDGVR